MLGPENKKTILPASALDNDNSTELDTAVVENNNNVTDGNSTTESSLLVSEHHTGTNTPALLASIAVTKKSEGDRGDSDLGTDLEDEDTDLTTNSDLSRLLELSDSDEESTVTEEVISYSDASNSVTPSSVSRGLINETELLELEARSDSLQETKNDENALSRSLKVSEVSVVSFPSSSCPNKDAITTPKLMKPHVDSVVCIPIANKILHCMIATPI